MRSPRAPHLSHRFQKLASLAALGAVLSFGPSALAQSDADRATARELGQQGFAALDARDYATAEDRLRRADKLVHAPTLELGLARALAGQHKFVEAQETYQRILREGVPVGAPEAFRQAMDDARKEVGSVAPLIGGVTIVVQVSGGGEAPNEKVTIDGSSVNVASLGVRRAIDPGPHLLSVTADGFKPAEVRFTVPEGGSVDAPVTLEKDPNAVAATPTSPTVPTTPSVLPPPPLPPVGEQPEGGGFPRWLPFVGFGVGAAGLILGGVTGALALSDHSKLAGECSGGSCDSSHKSDLDSYHSMATLSTVGFVVGGVGVAAGALLLVLQPKPATVSAGTTGVRVTPMLGPTSLGAYGTF
jgi:hypothetical protein